MVKEGIIEASKEGFEVSEVIGRMDVVGSVENMVILEAGGAFETVHTRFGRIDGITIEKIERRGV